MKRLYPACFGPIPALRFVFHLGFVFLLGCGQASEMANSEGEWVALFQGESLEGWEQLNGTATYSIEDRAVVGRTTEGSPNSFLCTIETYGDFELEFEERRGSVGSCSRKD